MRGIQIFLILLVFGLFSSDAAPVQKVDPESIKTVHIVWMNHLDVGFTIPGNIAYTVNVLNKYFKDYFPLAINISRELKQKYEEGGPRLIYTTHPWLVANYLDCNEGGLPILKELNVTLDCPTPLELKRFKQAVKDGDITWHAFPFNAEVETYDETMLGSALRISERLSEQLGVKKPLTMSQRDVPGLTRSIIPHLTKRGVKAISVGVNTASSPAAIPNINVWREPQTNEEVYLMYHPGDYGGDNITDAVLVPGSDHALIMHVRSDNQGPGSADEVALLHYIQHLQFPNAQIKASTFDNYVDTLDAVKENIPVFEKEIGDTWIYGVPSDPLKVATMRAFSKVRAKCQKDRICDPEDLAIVRFDRLLMKHGEHTWGIDVKTYLHDNANWTNAQFEAAKNGDNYQQMIKAWIDQRSYQYAAMKVLGDHPLANLLAKELKEMMPSIPNLDGFNPVSGDLDTKNVVLRFGSDGSIEYLLDKKTGRKHANPKATLGKFLYQTFDSQDFDTYLNEYGNVQGTWWFKYDFGKVNLSESNAKHAHYSPRLQTVYRKGDQFVLFLRMPSFLHTQYGSPSMIYVVVNVESGQNQTRINWRVQWFDKTPTRLPESLWFSFNPIIHKTNGWTIDKLGCKIEPHDIVKNGSFHLHGTTKGIFMDGLNIYSEDAAVVSPGKATPFPIPLDKVEAISRYGMSFNLYNNIWGTNYIMWYPYLDEDKASLFRFTAVLNS